MNNVVSAIQEYDNFAVITHINPDGDALGSAVALNLALLCFGKKSELLLLSEMPSKYRFKEFEAEYVLFEKRSSTYDCIISVDCADIKRLGEAKNIFKNAFSINIDHHISNTNFANLNYITAEPSTGEMIFTLIKALKIPFNLPISNALYIAISTDTGNFCYENTTADTFLKCAELVESGVPVAKLANYLFNSQTYAATQLIGRVIANLRIFYDGKLAVTKITLEDLKDTGAGAEDCENVINIARDIDTVEMAVFVRQMKTNLYKVSFRSKERIDVMEIAKQFDGGGHIRAAGCSMSGDINDIYDTILTLAKEFF